MKRLKELELESQRLRKAVADLTLDKLILAEAARGMYGPPRACKPDLGLRSTFASMYPASSWSTWLRALMGIRRLGRAFY